MVPESRSSSPTYRSKTSLTRPPRMSCGNFLKIKLPEHMVPYAYVHLDALPVDCERKDRSSRFAASSGCHPRGARGDVDAIGAGYPGYLVPRPWLFVRLGSATIFSILAATSLLLASVHARLQKNCRSIFPITDLFEFPTVRSLAHHLGGKIRPGSLFRRRATASTKATCGFCPSA